MTLLGAALTFNSADGNWDVSLHGVNLTNRQYIIAGNSERYINDFGCTQATYARPREWWLGVERNFE
jgi:iron complex outermembrane receptor protein